MASKVVPSNPAALARRLAEGDAEALTAWFEEQVDPLYAFVYYRVRNNPDVAADVTQATFTAALERLREFDPSRGEMRTWLRTLSRNIIRSHLSRDGKAVSIDAEWNGIDDSLKQACGRIDRDLLPESLVERAETRELVERTLSRLPPQYRAVLEAKYVEARPLEAIARERAATLDAVKSILRRARAAFREAFVALAKVE